MEKNLPLWKMALLASPDSFGTMPADFLPKLFQTEEFETAENKIAKSEAKKEKPKFYYTAIKTQFCADSNLCFSESIATAYFRILENKGEKLFLQGNVFLAKITKAVFEKDENLFSAACETYKDENYFLECIESLKEQGFVFEEETEISKDSWLNLFKAVLLLTEEYLATKCELPNIKAFECEENSENPSDLKIIFVPQNTSEEELKEAALMPLKSVPCSSDFLSIGTSFFDFLSENFPCQGSESELTEFLDKFYEKNVCKNLNWLYQAITTNSMPIPDFIGTGIMEANKFAAYKDKKIYINHRLALDSLRNQKTCFILLLAMLHEYGHFLDDILHEKMGLSGDSEGEEGKIFASRFVDFSAANLFDANFKFMDLNAPNPKGENQRFSLEISSLTFEQRKEILSIFEFSEDLEFDSLELPCGETIENLEFFGIVNVTNAISKTHQHLTETGAKSENVNFNSLLTDGSIWPDFPTKTHLETNILYSLGVLGFQKDVKKDKLVYESHYGENQHWHSMCPKLTSIPTNEDVRNRILKQAEEWYSEAIKKKKQNKNNEGLFILGKLCHTVQDSFVLAHCWRRYIGDENFIEEQKIDASENGKIWTFQDYKEQDGNFHAFSDAPKQKNGVKTIGYKSAEEATKQIFARYSKNLEWHERYSHIYPIKDYISKIYEICECRKNLPSGGSHPWFHKKSKLSSAELKKILAKFSSEIIVFL